MEEPKIIADPIHGMMIFEPYLVKIINHPYFQRLRHIKQLQGVEHVYPGGVHSRFSHSLGVCFLAGKVLDNLKRVFETEKPGYDISDFDKKCVTIAALCHDIGHGPFSHLYEKLSKEIDGNPCEHETRSKEITEMIIDELQLFENKNKEAKKIIGDMIQGKEVEKMSEEERKKAFLYQIVNNKNNGVDVDKWDYFIRDSHACGFPNNFDKERALSVLRVRRYQIGTEKEANVLSFPLKDRINLYNMFNLRYTLHSKVYQHPVVKCVEEMIADVLKLADNNKILQRNSVSTKECRGKDALEKYCLMDDRLLYLIYHAKDNDTENNLQQARAIMDRIHQRDFYRCICEYPLDSSEKGKRIPDDKEKEKELKEKLEEKIETKIRTNQLNEEIRKEIEKQKKDFPNIGGPFRISIAKINYGNKDKNPIPNVFFYKKGGDFVIEHEEPKKSPMVPSKFEEVTLRVFCTLKHCDRIQLETQIESYFDEFFRMPADSSTADPI